MPLDPTHLAAHSVCSPPPCGEGLGVGVRVSALRMSSSTVSMFDCTSLPTEQHAVAVRFEGCRCPLRTCCRVLTTTPTPNPSPQGGGEHTACVATVLRRDHRRTRRVDRAAASPILARAGVRL